MAGKSKPYKSRVRGAAKGKLRQQLEDVITKGGFKGRKRCQHWELRDDKQWQCPQPRRKSFRTCSSHGAGTKKRENAGTRENPRDAALLAQLEHGEHASDETRQSLLERYPELGALYEQHLADPNILSLRSEVAWAKAMAQHYRQRADLERTSSGAFEGEAEILLAIKAGETVAKMVRHEVMAQKARGAISHEELRLLVVTFGEALEEFVAPDRIDACKRFVRERLTGPLLRSALSGDRPGAGATVDDVGDGE